MSDPKRFDPLSDGMWENSAGDYVLYADYARLKAEVEAYSKVVSTAHADLFAENARLKAEVDRLISVSEAWKKRRLDKVEAECINWSDYEKLKAEVERLRKAGDGMAEVIWLSGCVSGMEIKELAVKVWNAAKEGKQS